MAQAIPDWANVAFTFLALCCLGLNAVLLGRAKKERLVRPLLRYMTGRPRARSLSLSTTMARAEPQQRRTADTAKILFTDDSSGSSSGWEAAAERWVSWDPNASTKAAVQRWIDSGDEDAAKK